DVVLRETRVGQRAQPRLGVQLRQGLRVGLARGVLVDSRDVRLALDRHGPVASSSSWVRILLQSQRPARQRDGSSIRRLTGRGASAAPPMGRGARCCGALLVFSPPLTSPPPAGFGGGEWVWGRRGLPAERPPRRGSSAVFFFVPPPPAPPPGFWGFFFSARGV